MERWKCSVLNPSMICLNLIGFLLFTERETEQVEYNYSIYTIVIKLGGILSYWNAITSIKLSNFHKQALLPGRWFINSASHQQLAIFGIMNTYSARLKYIFRKLALTVGSYGWINWLINIHKWWLIMNSLHSTNPKFNQQNIWQLAMLFLMVYYIC